MNSKDIIITFVVIGKNEGWRLEKSLTAIRRLAASELSYPYEIIYVDSQSTDDSISLAQQYADKIYLITGECSAAIGRNVGAMEATGEILFFLDGDMELRNGVFTTILSEDRLKYPIIEGVDYNILYDNDWHKREESPRSFFVEGNEWSDCSPSGGMFVVESKVWNEVGGMDNRFRRCEDFDFGFRAYKAGHKTHRIGQLWVNHHTRYYDLRNEPLTVDKYLAMLTRKYCLRGFAFKTLLWWNYSSYMLLVCMLLFIATLNFWIIVPYVLLLGYRTIKVQKRNPVRLNWAITAYKRFAKDVLLIFYLCTFFPKQPVVSYKRIK